MKRRSYQVILFLVALLVLPLQTLAGTPFTAKVIAITDGDTLKVLTDQTQQVKIRLAEIDTRKKTTLGQSSKRSTVRSYFW